MQATCISVGIPLHRGSECAYLLHHCMPPAFFLLLNPLSPTHCCTLPHYLPPSPFPSLLLSTHNALSLFAPTLFHPQIEFNCPEHKHQALLRPGAHSFMKLWPQYFCIKLHKLSKRPGHTACALRNVV